MRIGFKACETAKRQAFRLAAIFCLQSVSLAVYAEGAVRIFDCDFTQVCDAAGRCQPASTHVTFRMAPVTLDALGAGDYLLSHGDRSELSEQELPMQALSEIGPFVWTDENTSEERHTLVISSATELLWHTLSLTEPPVSSIRFLNCTQQQ